MTPVLEFEQVTVKRPGKILLNRIDWHVGAGDRWVILGPNDAGKTTLLQLAGAQMHPTSGTVTILGERLGRVDVFELRPRIGHMTTAITDRIPADEAVRDVVMSAAYAITGRWQEEYDAVDRVRAEQILAELGVGHLAERKFVTLSEGERKRTMIARAVMTDPELLLLDEPAAGLDLGAREDLLNTLQMLAESPQAPVIVMVSHHVEEIPLGFSHALLLRDGHTVVGGPIHQAINAASLSDTFGMRLELENHHGRFAARRVAYGQRARRF